MNKKIIGFVAVFCALVAVTTVLSTKIHPVNAAAPTAPLADGQFNCFDLFKFGSIDVNFTGTTQSASAGSELNLVAHITNQNAYPVVDGSLYVKIYRLQSSDTARKDNGDNLVDEMYAIKGINLAGHGKLDRAITWKVPSSALTGKYQIVSYFLSAEKANMMGLPFTDDIHGAPFVFDVAGLNGGVSFDKNSVTLNGGAYKFIGIAKPLDATKPVVVKATVVNTTKSVAVVPVVARVYRWSQTDADGHRTDMTEQVTLQPGEKKSVSFTVKDQESLTMVAIEADYKDSKSLLDVRFGREGLSYPRVNNLALANYPLKSGQPATMFVCAHAAGVSAMSAAYNAEKPAGPFAIAGSKIVLTLSDTAGNILNKYIYTGALTADMMGFKSTFVPKVSTGDLMLRADAYQGDIKLDTITVRYNCDAIGTNGCSNLSDDSVNPQTPTTPMSGDTLNWVGIIIGLLIVLVILSVAGNRMKKKGGSPLRGLKVLALAVAGLGSLAVLGISPNLAHADTATAVVNGSPNWQQSWMSNASIANCGVPHVGACMGLTIATVSVNVTYGATVTKGGVTIANGATLQPGDQITFVPTPFAFGDINWSFTGGGYGTPVGYWNFVNTYAAQDFVYNASGIGDFYNPVAVTKPAVSLISVSGPVTGSGFGPYTVTGAGTITASVSFAATTGYMDAEGCSSNGLGCGSHGHAYDFAVPQTNIPFSFTSIIPNSPPVAPTISGPTPVFVGSNNTYNVVATDPDGNNIYYNIDFDSDHSSVSQVLGTVGSGVSESFTKSYGAPGTYTIYAQAVDSTGAGSAWSSYNVVVNAIPTYTLIVQMLGGGSGTITSNPAGITCSSGTCSMSGITSGTVVTLHGAANGGSSFDTWGGNCSGFTPPADCTITMNADRNANGTFSVIVIPQQSLGVTVSGNGSVSSSPAGITCPSGSCSASYNINTAVTLTATPSGSDTFTGWSGACAGVSPTCVVTLSADKAATANFTYTLSVNASGPVGSGSIAGTGIACAAGNVGTCSSAKAVGSSVTLTPTANGGYSFTGWSGGGCSGTGNCTVTMAAATSVTGTFAAIPPNTLTTTVTGAGGVTSAPAGINCPSGACSASFSSGSTVNLTATPTGANTFLGWGGACSGVGACAVTMSSGQSVTASFTYMLTTTVTGPASSGSIAGGGISCAAGNVGTCSIGATPSGTIVLVPTPGSGYKFNGWSGGGCSGTGNCSVLMSSAQAVTATFALIPGPCTDGVDNDGDGLIDAADPGCTMSGGTGEPGGGPITNLTCSPATPTVTTVTPAAPGGSVVYNASATSLGSGNVYEYNWDGAGWISSASYSKNFATPGTFAGPTLQIRDAGSSGPVRNSDNTCGKALVPGTVTVKVSGYPNTPVNTQVAVPQGKPIAVSWAYNLAATYSCTGTVTPSSGDASWSAWTSNTFAASSGTAAPLNTTASTPIGAYNFTLTCVDTSASPGPTYTSTATARVVLSTEGEF